MKNILIIGASKGIGLSLAKIMSQNPENNLYTVSRTETEELARLESNHISMDIVNDDIGNLDQLPEELHGLVYCPGAIQLRPFARLKPKDFIEDYKLQVLGPVRVIQTLLPKLKKAGQASIVLFSTVAVQTGLNFHSMVSASKGAIEGLSRSLAAEFAPKIRVNCIAPSLTDTPLAFALLNTDQKRSANAERHPLKRVGRAEDIASMAAFLLSEQGSWITGQVMHVDGGLSKLKT